MKRRNNFSWLDATKFVLSKSEGAMCQTQILQKISDLGLKDTRVPNSGEMVMRALLANSTGKNPAICKVEDKKFMISDSYKTTVFSHEISPPASRRQLPQRKKTKAISDDFVDSDSLIDTHDEKISYSAYFPHSSPVVDNHGRKNKRMRIRPTVTIPKSSLRHPTVLLKDPSSSSCRPSDKSRAETQEMLNGGSDIMKYDCIARNCISMEEYVSLSKSQQRYLASLLPSSDVRKERSGVRLLPNALSNPFFVSYFREWQDKLGRGELAVDFSAKIKVEDEKQVAKDPWKENFFEDVWGLSRAEELRKSKSKTRQRRDSFEDSIKEALTLVPPTFYIAPTPDPLQETLTPPTSDGSEHDRSHVPPSLLSEKDLQILTPDRDIDLNSEKLDLEETRAQSDCCESDSELLDVARTALLSEGVSAGERWEISPSSELAAAPQQELSFQSSENDSASELCTAESKPAEAVSPVSEKIAAEVDLPQSGVESPQSQMDLPQSVSHWHESDVKLSQPDVHLTQPSVHLPQPDVHLMQPDVHLTQPSVHLPEPDVHLMQPDVQLMKPVQDSLEDHLLKQEVESVSPIGHFESSIMAEKSLPDLDLDLDFEESMNDHGFHDISEGMSLLDDPDLECDFIKDRSPMIKIEKLEEETFLPSKSSEEPTRVNKLMVSDDISLNVSEMKLNLQLPEPKARKMEVLRPTPPPMIRTISMYGSPSTSSNSSPKLDTEPRERLTLKILKKELMVPPVYQEQQPSPKNKTKKVQQYVPENIPSYLQRGVDQFPSYSEEDSEAEMMRISLQQQLLAEKGITSSSVEFPLMRKQTAHKQPLEPLIVLDSGASKPPQCQPKSIPVIKEGGVKYKAGGCRPQLPYSRSDSSESIRSALKAKINQRRYTDMPSPPYPASHQGSGNHCCYVVKGAPGECVCSTAPMLFCTKCYHLSHSSCSNVLCSNCGALFKFN